ncbi:sialidase family protein [Fodinicola feengrottensis]|uniref:sialidase family protein n=1 Tax=Fodinicola feengrottensis TaxID=435914 RepID=UPI0013D7BB54|nr:hypothetical protein [Fodinicola feengrottensis]
MPDIDFAEVRDEIDSQLSPPLPIADITHRAHRRNRARAAVTVLTVGVAVAAVTVGAIQLTADRERSPVVPPAGVTDPTPPSGKAGPITPPVRSSTFPAGSQATFTAAVNQKISYAITRLPGIAVTFAWSRTVDGGLTWVSHDLPTLAQPVGTPFTSGPQVLDLTTVIAGQLISHDGGTSWTRRPASGVARERPAGWLGAVRAGCRRTDRRYRPSGRCIAHLHGCAEKLLAAVLGRTDRRFDSIWLGCPGGLVVSHNRGASWKAFHVLPADANKGTTFTGLTGDQPIVWVDSADGQRGYAIADGGAPGARQQTIFRTDNGGTSWQKIRVVQGNVPTMDGGLTGLSVLPDGSFLNGGVTANIKPLVRSSDDGATYQPLAPVFPTEDPVRTPLGTFVSFHWEDVGSPKNIYVVSDDGIHWSPIPVPTGVKPPQF